MENLIDSATKFLFLSFCILGVCAIIVFIVKGKEKAFNFYKIFGEMCKYYFFFRCIIYYLLP